MDGLMTPGERAPALDLPLAEPDAGRAIVPDPRGTKPVLVVFFKESCPTCRFTLPFVQRLHEHVGPRGGRILGVSQDGSAGARSLAAELRLSFPIGVDGPGFPVSEAWGLVAVPTIYLVDAGGFVLRGSAGFHRADLEEMAADLASAVGSAPPVLYRGHESVPAMKAG